jgi:regulatory protein
MHLVTRIQETRGRPSQRKVFLNGALAFSCSVNVVARFRLREGLTLSDEQVGEVLGGQVRQQCFDKAMRLLQARLHSRAELSRKLARQKFAALVIAGVLDDLARMGYLNDQQFATDRALSAARHKLHGRERARAELMKSGINGPVLEQALDDAYGDADAIAPARQLAMKKAPALRRLGPVVARRRLVGMLQRRGFEYESIKSIVDEVLGTGDE